jgi:hypothetical protein
MINGIITFVLLAGLGYIVYRVWTRYRSTTGTTWERILATAKGSATIAWQYIVIAGGAVISSLGFIAEVLNMPDVQAWLKASLQPSYVGLALVVISIITVYARLRTLAS